MSEQETKREKDELSQELAEWRVPPAPGALDTRVFASYRSGEWRHVPWWRAAFTTSVRMPLPVAVALVLLCVVSTVAALRQSPGVVPAPPAVHPPAPARETVRETPAVSADLRGFEFEREIKVRIIRQGERR